MKKTKIICTIGPACSSEPLLTAMLQSGLDAARFIYSKETAQDTSSCIRLLRTLSRNLSRPVAILLDIGDLSCPARQNHEGLFFGIKQDVDYIACQAITGKEDLLDIQTILEEQHAQDIGLLAKIENQASVNNIDAICSVASGVMIDRAKLGEEIDFEQLPSIQKQLVTKCRLLGKQVITATFMLPSMVHQQKPSSAETSDVANAIYDGTSAVMLSDETALGDYPVDAVKVMSRIVSQTEENIHYRKRFFSSKFLTHSRVDALSHAACNMAIDVNAKALVICTRLGSTAAMVSRFHSPTEIAAVTNNEKTYQKLALLWGIIPVLTDSHNADDNLFLIAKEYAAKVLSLHKGDSVVLADSMTNRIDTNCNNNIIKIETVISA